MPLKKNSSTQSPKIPKMILIMARILALVSPNVAIRFAAKLFTTPIKHKIPKREHHMDSESQQEIVVIPSINKEITTYRYGPGQHRNDETKSDKKILLVHGWSGRGTQLAKIADALIQQGFSTVSFDAPAHGKSKGNSSLLPEFVAAILQLEKIYGPFEYAIGHSLGGMAILNAVKEGFNVKKAVTIGAADIIQDIIDDFIAKLKLKYSFGNRLKEYFENRYGTEMDSYSASRAARNVAIPVLIIHDQQDEEVPVKTAHHIHQSLAHSEIIITKGLGHRKILGNEEVIKKIITFMET